MFNHRVIVNCLVDLHLHARWVITRAERLSELSIEPNRKMDHRGKQTAVVCLIRNNCFFKHCLTRMTDFCLHVLKSTHLKEIPGKYPSRRKCLSAVAFFTPGQRLKTPDSLGRDCTRFTFLFKEHMIFWLLLEQLCRTQTYFLYSSELWIVVSIMLAPIITKAHLYS